MTSRLYEGGFHAHYGLSQRNAIHVTLINVICKPLRTPPVSPGEQVR